MACVQAQEATCEVSPRRKGIVDSFFEPKQRRKPIHKRCQESKRVMCDPEQRVNRPRATPHAETIDQMQRSRALFSCNTQPAEFIVTYRLISNIGYCRRAANKPADDRGADAAVPIVQNNHLTSKARLEFSDDALAKKLALAWPIQLGQRCKSICSTTSTVKQAQ